MILFHVYDALVRSDLPNVIQDGSGALGLYALRKFNCKQKRCPRIGRHAVQGTTYHTCARHTTAPVHEKLFAQHAQQRPDQHDLLNP
jgi:hypothetical protein